MLHIAHWIGRCFPLIAGLALTTGCAGARADHLLKTRTSAYVFHHPAADVESAARRLLEDDHFEVLVTNHGIVRTGWRPIIDDDVFASSYERYVIVVQRLTREHCRVQAIKLSYSSVGMETEHPHALFKGDGSSANVNTATYGKGKRPLPMGPPTIRRDLDLEWKLIAREEPERARVVQSDIDWLLTHP